MSKGNVATEMQYGLPFPTPDTTGVTVVKVGDTTYTDGVGLIVYTGSEIISVFTSLVGPRVAPGCMAFCTDASTSTAVAINTGTTALPVWTALT